MDQLTIGAALKLDGMTALNDWMRAHERPLEIQDFVSADALIKERDDLIAAYRPLLADYPGEIGIHGPFLGLDFTNPDFEIRAIVQKRFMQGLEVAEALGATHMVIHSPFTFWLELNKRNFSFIREGMFADGAECLAPVLARAGEIGCTLMLENIDDVDPLDRIRLLESMDSPWIKASIDTGHAQLAHGQYHAPPVTDFIDAAGALLGHVHLQDADGYADRHWHPGEGTLPWPAIFAAIRAGGGNPRLLVEVKDRHEMIPETVARLAHCGVI